MKNIQLQKDIPKGWIELSVGDIFSYLKSYAFSRDNLLNSIVSDGVVGNIHYGDLHATFTSPSVDISRIQIPIIKNQAFVPNSNDLLKDGDLIMADASEDYEGVGVTVSVHGIKDKKVVGGLHTFVLRDEKSLTNEYFRQYIFINPIVRNKLQKIANGVSVYGISKTAVSKIKLLLPSLPEQNRIVAVLETWDKVIEKLTKKIELKKHIQKELMGSFLVGKIRFPGFTEKWKNLKFRELFEILKKPNGLKGEEYQSFGSFPIIDQSKDHLISGYTDKKEYLYDFTKNSVVVFGDHSRVIKYIDCCVAFGNDGVKLFQSKSILNLKFGYYLLKNFKVPETGYNRHFKYLDTATFFIPDINEQISIANILTTSDKEIELLEQKLQQIKQQKKYLLNNLITGAIRTPENLQ